jgi:hypothetical protein
MNRTALRKTQIIRALEQVSDSQLESIRVYITAILSDSGDHLKPRRSLKGIWEGVGFERVADLDAELQEVRKQLRQATLSRSI